MMIIRSYALPLIAALSAMPLTGAGADGLTYVRQIVDKVYLTPLRLSDAVLQIETDRFRSQREPHAFVVHVYKTARPDASEVLRIDIVTMGTYLQYVSARGSAIQFPVPLDGRDQTINNAVLALRDLGGFE